MIYTWRCTECDAVCEVERPAQDYLLPPSQEEGEQAVRTVHWDCKHEWKKVILTAPPVPFEQLKGTVFMNQNGDYPPRKV